MASAHDFDDNLNNLNNFFQQLIYLNFLGIRALLTPKI